MSGGFFRGTSADQDTRFSNKKAKLLKTQKFASDLEHLVDMTKVKMDVMKPWIATRVTELLGFEDEVLINFIFGLLEGKDVNGKEVQISLTGFMEKNTGKFMKELWALLLSAQQNSSGVPQQFLDAKEEETRKKMEEADRIANEIQKKREKESRDMDQERVRNMDGVVERKTANSLDHSPRASNGHPNEKSNNLKRDGERGAAREMPRSRSSSKSADGVKSQNIDKDSPAKKHVSDRVGLGKSDEKYLQLSNTAKEDGRKRSRVTEEQTYVPDAVSDGSDDNAHGRNKRSKRHDTGSNDESNDSEAKDRKEAKRRRRAERKLRKEEKRRRREERRGKREGRHAEKHKLKRGDSSSPSDGDPSDSPHAKRSEIHSGENEVDAKQKKLEVELRLKALESFKAKKSSNR